MKTCLSYYGGKSRIATQIVPHIMAIPHTVFIEPYFGGGAVLYAKGKIERGSQSNYCEAVNDLNKQLITFWRVAREQPEALARWVELTPYSQEEYREARKIYNNPTEYSDLKVAWAAYIQCNMSFSNKIEYRICSICSHSGLVKTYPKVPILMTVVYRLLNWCIRETDHFLQ